MVKQSTVQVTNGNRAEEEKRQQHRGDQAQQSKTITMAEDLKYKASLQKKAKLGDGSNIAAEDR
jgi:hypothetical protein